MYHLYADDIQMYLVVDPSIPGDVVSALFKLTQFVKDIQQWMTANKLKLNQEKTEFFIACSPYHRSRISHLTLWIGDTEIPQSQSIRNLGVVFDQHMTMSHHITQLSKSVNWNIRNIYRIRRFIDTREDAYSRTAYFIRHTALSRTYAIVAYVRHNNNAGSPVFGIQGLPHWPESSQFQMKLQFAWNQRTTHPFLWFKTHGCEWLGDINVCKLLYYQKQGLVYWLGWTDMAERTIPQHSL